MLRKVTWRFWGAVAVYFAAYIVLGFWLASDGNAETWMYRIGLAGVTLAAALFVLIYTAAGLRGGGARWWTNTLGTALVVAAVTLVQVTAPFAWAVIFDNGRIPQAWLVWTEVLGPAEAALAWTALCWVFLRIRWDQRNGNGGGAASG